MKTTSNIVLHVADDADIRGSAGKSDSCDPYACTWIGETMLFFWDKSQLEVLRDLCNKQLEEWK